MSLLSNNKKKDKKGGKPAAPNSAMPAPKGKANTKGAAKNTRVNTGSNRGS